MSRIQQTVRGLVLSRRNFGEADRLVALFTQADGLWHLQARGVRKLSSRRGRHLEPFTEITAQLTGKTHAAQLAAAETIEYFPALQRDDDALRRVQILSGGLLALFGEHDPQPALYLMMRRFWGMAPRLPARRRPMAEVAAVLQLLEAAGIAPRLFACRVCQHAGADRAACLEPASGSIACALCVPAAPLAWRLSPVALKAARVAAARRELAETVAVPAAEAANVTAPWRAYLAWQGGGKNFRGSGPGRLR